MKKPFYQRIPFRLLRRLRREVTVNVAAHALRVDLTQPQSLSLLYWSPNWKSELLARVLAHRRGAFLDIGVNVGTTLFDFLSTGQPGPYFGFEPNPACAAFCTRLIQRNRLPHCHLVPVALSEQDGLGRLHFDPAQESDPAATLTQEIRPGQNVQATFVACSRFDSLHATLAPGPVGLVKIDVEGAELLVLRGMAEFLRRERPWIVCEVLDADAHQTEAAHRERTGALAGYLREHGYRIHHLRKHPELGLGAALAEFPFARWTPERAEECDYVFVPEEAAEEAARVFPGPAHA